MQVEFVDGALGHKEVRKRAETADEAVRVRREADLLDVATHPGLAEVAGFDDGDHPELRTSRIEGSPLAHHSSLDVEEIAGVVAAVAATLADLHGMGLVHGAVAPEHVLLDGDGRPVLCSLGFGGLVGEGPSIVPTLAPAFLDSQRLNGEPLDPSFDVFGLGALLATLLAGATAHSRSGSVDALRRIADRATAGSGRLTARQVADAVHDAVPGARLPGAHSTADPPRPRPDPLAVRRNQTPLEGWRRAQKTRSAARSRLPLGRATALVVGVVALLAAVLLVWARGRPAPGPVAVAIPTTSVAVTTSVMASTTTTRLVVTTPSTTALPRRPGCPTVTGPLSADVDGDGCPDAVRFDDGVVEAAGRRWAVGEPGDVMAVGDWACAGSRSLAVLRPRTGHVFAFTGWAAEGRDLTAALVGEVMGGQALRAADIDGDGCNELVVERRSGAPAVLQPPRSLP